MPSPKNPNPLTERINREARAIRRILNIVGSLDRAARGRVLRTVVEMADEAIAGVATDAPANGPTASLS